MNIEAIFNKLMRAKSSSFRVAFPAIVMNIDKLVDGFIDVKPIVNQHNNYTDEWYEYPLIRDVRVIFPSNKTSTICFPVNLGDTVDLVFQSSNTQKFVDGNNEVHNPLMKSTNNLRDVVAFIGFERFQDSCFNANNYSKDFKLEDLNIVHNKNTSNESHIALQDDGDIRINGHIINMLAQEVKTNDALVVVDNDILIQGISLIDFIRTHTHQYTDDGTPMTTQKPNI